MNPPLTAVIIYARNIQRTVAFYQTYFGFTMSTTPGDRLVELTSPGNGMRIFVHQAAKSVKLGQVGIKLAFSVEDVEAFKQTSAPGLVFGSTHQADGYSFANAKDPDKNSICISSRAFRGGHS